MNNITVNVPLDRFKELESAEETLKKVTNVHNEDKRFMIVRSYGGEYNYFPIEDRAAIIIGQLKQLLEKHGIHKDYIEQA